MFELVTIFLGGSIGAGLRYLIYLFATNCGISFGGTFAVNIIGCLLLGILAELEFEEENRTHNNFKLFLTTGIVSSFTTFSTFSFEAFSMIKSGNIQEGIIYILSSLILGMLAVLTGFVIAKSITARKGVNAGVNAQANDLTYAEEENASEIKEREDIWAD